MAIQNFIWDYGRVLIQDDVDVLGVPIAGSKEDFDLILQEADFAHGNHLRDLGDPQWKEYCLNKIDSSETLSDVLKQRARNFLDAIETEHGYNQCIIGPISENIGLLRGLSANFNHFGLTNFSRQTLDWTQRRADLAFFKDTGLAERQVVSADHGMCKPDSALYRVLLDKFSLTPETCVFIDDKAENVAAFIELGGHGIHYQTPSQLQTDLAGLGVEV